MADFQLNGTYYRSIIYNAASEGKLERVKVFTEPHRGNQTFISDALNMPIALQGDNPSLPDLKKLKFPLVIAARNGRTDVVEYLLDLGADPSLRGAVEFDNDKIQGTSPLWAASAAGHLDIVKLLVEKSKADVNQTTNTNSTPLRGACYDGHLPIVKYLLEHGADPHIPNRHGHTCLMIAAFKEKTDIVRVLLEHGVDVNARTERGNTVLHDAAESGHSEIIEMLLAHGAIMQKDMNGVDPLLAAAVGGRDSALEVLAQHMNSPLRHREALKLLGCTYTDKMMNESDTMEVWKRAMQIELSTDELKAIREMELLAVRQEVYDCMREFQNYEQLQRLEGSVYSQRIQSLIIRERILGESHSDVHFYLRFRGAVFCDMGNLKKCYDLWKHALTLQQRHYAPIHTGITQTLVTFTDTLVITLNEIANGGHMIDNVRVQCDWVHWIFGQVCHELERVVEWGDRPLLRETECCGLEQCEHSTVERELKRIVGVSLELVNMTERLYLPSLKAENDVIRKLDVKRLMRVVKHLKIPFLHYILEERQSSHGDALPKVDVMKQFLKEKPHMNDKDSLGNTPLHILLQAKDLRKSLIELLLENGANLLARNDDNQTPLSILQVERAAETRRYLGDIKLGKYITLLGLTAHAMRYKHQPLFDGIEEEFLPRDIVQFYLAH